MRSPTAATAIGDRRYNPGAPVEPGLSPARAALKGGATRAALAAPGPETAEVPHRRWRGEPRIPCPVPRVPNFDCLSAFAANLSAGRADGFPADGHHVFVCEILKAQFVPRLVHARAVGDPRARLRELDMMAAIESIDRACTLAGTR